MTSDAAVAAELAAERLCRERGERFTELRRQVYRHILDANRPIRAYDLLELLGQTRGRVGPPTVYRALEFLTEQGLIHRVHSLNAYIACCSAASPHSAELLICRLCGIVVETPCAVLGAHIRDHADRHGFRAEQIVVEVQGICRTCQEPSEQGPLS